MNAALAILLAMGAALWRQTAGPIAATFPRGTINAPPGLSDQLECIQLTVSSVRVRSSSSSSRQP